MKRQKPQYIDLHTHTNYSDGLFVKPEQNVAIAAMNGLDVFAITDHDTFDGYFEVRDVAKSLGLVLLPGVELTTPKYHLLGLNFDPFNTEFRKFAEESKMIQNEQCKERVAALRSYGFDITFEDVVRFFPESRLARYNLYMAMIRKPSCREKMEREFPDLDPWQKYRKYFNEMGLLENLPEVGVSVRDVSYEVHKAGGVWGIAHPEKDIKSLDEIDELILEGMDFGEAQLRFEDHPNSKSYQTYLSERKVPKSKGSDYHGPIWDRKILCHGNNVMTKSLRGVLNRGYEKIPDLCLEEVCC